MLSRKVLGAAAAALAIFGVSAAVIAQSYPPPQVQSLDATDLIQIIPRGNPAVGNQYASAPLLGNYSETLVGNNPENVLIGGDATTNLFQRATTGSSVTTTVTYGGPDRWAYWSGAGTAMTVSRSTTSGDIPGTYLAGFKMARTAAQTGVIQMCMIQEVESANSYQFAGNTAELDFHAATGSTFSAASANMVAYIITGTGTDEGVAGSASGAYGLNAGGGGSGSWTGQVNWAATVNLGGISTLNRYTVAAPIPAGTKEIAVALCYTPVGTAGANDYITFSGIQLTRNSALTSLVSANASGTATALNPNDTRAKAFSRRSQGTETALQQRYFYSVLESATSGAQQSASGNGATTTTCSLYFPFPVNMRTAPTFAAIATFSTSTFTVTHIATATALSTPYLAVLGANTVNGGSITATVASGLTTGQTCVLTSAAGSGSFGWTAEL